MIVPLYGSTGGVAFYPKDKDGCDAESAIVITQDTAGSTILAQNDESICLPSPLVDELIKALRKHKELL